ncbi:MAG: cytidine deaminase [Myxococcota bacterium]
MSEVDWDELQTRAARVRANAHAPYSHFRVGAALLADDGRIFYGTNVENASYGLALCAERAAVAAAIGAGARSFRALALVSDASVPATPCGMCRQVLAEFPPSFPVRSYTPDGTHLERTVAQLLPDAFRL